MQGVLCSGAQPARYQLWAESYRRRGIDRPPFLRRAVRSPAPLAVDPEAILFDEPTSALDPELVGEVLAVMRNLAEDSITMVVVTHEIQFAQSVADKGAVHRQGLDRRGGATGDLIGNPREERTREFLQRLLVR